jgi:hypothetical protein
LSGLVADADAADRGAATLTDAIHASPLLRGGYLALNFKGRSVGSGLGAPRWDELLGAKFPPAEALVQANGDKAAAGGAAGGALAGDEADLLACQAAFYAALTSGDLVAMEQLFAPDDDGAGGVAGGRGRDVRGGAPEVSEVLASGGRLDGWPTCLAVGARPAELASFDCDATVLTAAGEANGGAAAAAEACTTSVEEVGTRRGATNLSTQRWVRRARPPAASASDAPCGGALPAAAAKWRLALHQTIPYSPAAGAGGLLRCDGRGCVALLASGSYTN